MQKTMIILPAKGRKLPSTDELKGAGFRISTALEKSGTGDGEQQNTTKNAPRRPKPGRGVDEDS